MVLKVRAQKNEHINGSLFLRHVNRKLLYDILKGKKEWLSYSVGVMSHTERKIPQKTNGCISDAPFRMPQQSYDNWNTTELSVN